MFYSKRITGLVAALIAMAALTIPVAADAGETDRAAGGVVESEYVQTGSLVTPVTSSGETDAYGEQQNSSSTSQDAVVFTGKMGETDRWANSAVEDEYVQTGSLVIAVDSSGETDAYGVERVVVEAAQDAVVFTDNMGETDRWANSAVEDEYVQTGSLVIAVDSSGETDAYAEQQNAARDVQEAIVIADHEGDTA